MTICTCLMPKPMSPTTPFTSLHDRDWQNVSEAFLLTSMEKNAERKELFFSHVIPFSFHFSYVKTAIDTASRNFTKGKALCLFQERQSITLKKQLSGWGGDQAKYPSAKMLYPSLTSEFSNLRLVKKEIHLRRGPISTGQITCPHNTHRQTCV